MCIPTTFHPCALLTQGLFSVFYKLESLYSPSLSFDLQHSGQNYDFASYTTYVACELKSLYFSSLSFDLQHSSQNNDFTSYTTYVVCVNLKCEWQDLQFNVDFERQIFKTVIFIYSRSFCHKSAERQPP